MKNFTSKTEQDLLDKNSFCLFYMEDGKIDLDTNFKNYDDMVNLLHIITNTKFALDCILEKLTDEEKNRVNDDLKCMKREPPFITPLSISSSE